MRNLFFVMIGVTVFSAAAAVVTGLPHAQPWVFDSFERTGLGDADAGRAEPLSPVAAMVPGPTR